MMGTPFPHRFLRLLTVLLLLSLFMLSHSLLEASIPEDANLCIVKVIDRNGELRFEIVDNDIADFYKKELQKEYKQAKEEWTKAREEWKNLYKDISFACPKPMKPVFKVVAKKLKSKSTAKIELETLKSQGPFCVVQKIIGDKKEQPEIIVKDEVKLKQYAFELDYFQNLKIWAQEKAAFEKENPGKEFEKAKPVKSQLKVLKNSLKTLEKANIYLSKYTR